MPDQRHPLPPSSVFLGPGAMAPGRVPGRPTVPGTEDVARGTRFALAAVPVGVAVVVAVWLLGHVASIPQAFVGILAIGLYEKGAGGVGRRGVLVVVGVVVAEALAGTVGAIVSDVLRYCSCRTTGSGGTLQSAAWSLVDPTVWAAYGAALGQLLLFGAIGVGLVLLKVGFPSRR